MAEILLIDDEAVLVKIIARSLERVGHSVATASDAAAGLRRSAEVPPDLVLLDLRLQTRRQCLGRLELELWNCLAAARQGFGIS